MLEPQFTGMTLHETTQQIDGGDIIHQTGIKIKKMTESMIMHAKLCWFL